MASSIASARVSRRKDGMSGISLRSRVDIIVVAIPFDRPAPGGNATGFTLFEYALAAKWLELVKEIAPGVTPVVVLRDSAIAAGIGQFAAVQTLAPVNIELRAAGLQEVGAIEQSIAGVARGAN